MRVNILNFACLALIPVWVYPVIDASAQSVTPTGSQSQKKEHTVRVLANDNGKVTKKDTVIVIRKGNNISYSAGNVIYKSDSVFLTGDVKTNEKMVTVFIIDGKRHTGKDSVKTTCIVSTGDAPENKAIHDLKWLGDGKRMIIMQDASDWNLDLATPPPVARLSMGKLMKDSFSFDPTDPDIVSYKKRNVGKDQEKITIIRKKRTKSAELRNIEVREE